MKQETNWHKKAICITYAFLAIILVCFFIIAYQSDVIKDLKNQRSKLLIANRGICKDTTTWVIPDLVFAKPDCTLWVIQGNDTIPVRVTP